MNPPIRKVIVLGSIAYEYLMAYSENFIDSGTFSIDHKKGDYQSTVTANSKVQHFGGNAGNIAYNLGLLNIEGTKIHLFGSVGKDFDSLGYKDHIIKFENIDLGIDVHDDLFTAACYILDDMNDNHMIIFHSGAMDKCKEIDLREKIKDPENYI